MKEKVLKTISIISFGVGLLLLIGTAGSADCGYISLGQMILQCVGCGVMIFVPVAIGLWRGW